MAARLVSPTGLHVEYVYRSKSASGVRDGETVRSHNYHVGSISKVRESGLCRI